MATNGTLGRKLRMGIVGGGQGSFIGRVHVTAAVLDNRAELVAGAFSSDAERSKASAADYAVDAARAANMPRDTIEKGLPPTLVTEAAHSDDEEHPPLAEAGESA